MSRKKEWLLLAVGAAVGMMLSPPLASAAENWLKATPSTQIFIVDGQNTELEAYAIGGYNYVKLRDIGKAVGFNVSYDAQFNAAVIDSTRPYYDDQQAKEQTGYQPTALPTEAETHTATDYAQAANSAVFTSMLTKEVYNAVREIVVNEDAILSGASPKVKLPSGIDTTQVSNLLAKISIQPVYELQTDGNGGYICDIHTSDANERARKSVAPFLQSIEGMSDREKVTQMAYYVADHLTYAIKYPYPDIIFGQDGQVEGCCMAYAYSFKTLCDLAEIPCLFVSNPTHQWNKVYVDGTWWDVDVTGDDAGDDMAREYWTVLNEPQDLQGSIYVDSIPEITAFAQEVLVPGSTK